MDFLIKRLIVFFLSMVPIIELRGAIPVGLANGLALWETLVLSILGNIIIIPFVVLLFNRILEIMRKFKLTEKVANRIEERAEKKSKKVENMLFWGLLLFVAIPLPGTGAWTGSMVAGLLKLSLKKAFPPIALGVIIAAAIVTCVTYGVIFIVT